ncbi:MAG: outer membrane protein assembly factor BamA [Betaproteobacteria bacterium]|nr:MAG: outer membrane protein assembly factor BamA [Betaproteobacteria bacterium]
MKTFALTLLAAALASTTALALDEFEVKDIRVEGIQRTEAGTVFSYLPVKVGETLTADKATAAIKALYATGFFKDVRLESQGQVLIVLLEERPAIASVEFTGMKEFQKDDIRRAFKDLGLAEGRILDKSLLDRAEQELKRQYYNRSLYAVQIKANTSPLERNRMAISFEVSEGEVAKIRAINLIGAAAYKEKDLKDLFVLRTPGWLTWFTKNDQYAKQKLAADIETLRSWYLNRGHLEFTIDSTQVSITPDKKDIYLTLNIKEGEKFSIAKFGFAGEMPVPEAELQKLVSFKAGDTFSREKLNEAVKKIGERLGNEGYAFANINAAPELDREKKTVAFTFMVDPGRKVYVNRINIAGNTRTQDKVVRREMRQMEGAWYDEGKIKRSRERIERLGYFKEVNIETPPVAGTMDQVNLNVDVAEQSTGSVMVGAGFSSSDGLVLTGSLNQNNLFGTGNRASAQVNTSKTNTTYVFGWTNPYFTPDGISLGWDAYLKKTDLTSASSTTSVAPYAMDTAGLGLRLGIPTSETNSLSVGAAVENNNLKISTTSTVPYYTDFAIRNGGTATGLDATWLRLDMGWAFDSRDSVLNPTKGSLQRLYGEIAPGLGDDLKFYKINYQHQWLKPLPWTNSTLLLNGQAGYGGGIGGSELPFWRNFYVGGIGSVRGFQNGSLGPTTTDSSGNIVSLGGNKQLIGNAEAIFPFPGSGQDKQLRLSAFVDVGAAYADTYSFADLRASTGMAVTWMSPMGPIKLSIATPLKKLSTDKTESFQFQMGSAF